MFKIRNCKDINFKNRSRPCIEFQMNRCSAPCVGNISKEDYALDVKNTISFLLGDTKKIVTDLICFIIHLYLVYCIRLKKKVKVKINIFFVMIEFVGQCFKSKLSKRLITVCGR